MKEYTITTDDTCDMPESFYEEHQIPYVSLNCMVNGQIFNKEHRADPHEFYEWMRSGAMPTTSQANAEDVKNCWLPYIEKGMDILHLGFSSGLSGSFNSARIAAEELMEEYPGIRIRVVDSLCASMGEGLLLYLCGSAERAGEISGRSGRLSGRKQTPSLPRVHGRRSVSSASRRPCVEAECDRRNHGGHQADAACG